MVTGEHIKVGRQDKTGRLEMNARITGRFPISFSDADEQGRGGTTTLEITPPTGNNIITFPDTTGTLITTGNLPSSVMLPQDDYTIQCQAFVAAAPSVSMGVKLHPPKHEGSFVFTDAYSSLPSASGGGGAEEVPVFNSRAENSFNVRATGGVKFVTGYTPSGKQLGVVLNAASSSWSVLSDRDSKDHVVAVDGVHVLETLVHKVPISTWSYEGDESVRHMGPMAQDFFDAFRLGDSRRHISSIDADGVAMAALQGLHAVHAKAQGVIHGLRAQVRESDEELKANEQLLLKQERLIDEAEASLRNMMALVQRLRTTSFSRSRESDA